MTNEAALAALGDQELDDSSVRERLPPRVVSLYSYLRGTLPRPESLRFSVDVAEAIDERTRDLSLVWPRFAVWLLVDPVDGVARVASNDVRTVTQRVAALYARVLTNNVVTATEWTAAEPPSSVGPNEAARAVQWAARWVTPWAAGAARDAGATITSRQASKLLALLQEAPWT